MDSVDAAEKEASEVLHSLLSVERVGKHLEMPNSDQITVNHPERSISVGSQTRHQSNLSRCTQVQDNSAVQWHTPVTIHQALFSNIPDNDPRFSGEQVVWQGHTIDINPEHMPRQSSATHSQTSASLSASQQRPASHTHSTITITTDNPENTYTTLSTPAELLAAAAAVAAEEEKKKKTKKTPTEKSATTTAKKKKHLNLFNDDMDTNQLEENSQQVRERFEKGCECQEENCFKGLSPEFVYRHRLNIAELTKAEHDMYLMGVTMAVLTNPDETVRHKERRRLRAQYVFQGRRVCLDAFLYLENCTHYQLKRIRKHVMTHGVMPRVHGNHGKKPHNTFPLDIYRHATKFLKSFIDKHTFNSPNQSTQTTGLIPNSTPGKKPKTSKPAPFYLPLEITKKTIHNAYREHCQQNEPDIKVMGYSTFRHFMKEQFPYVKFCKVDTKSSQQQTGNTSGNIGGNDAEGKIHQNTSSQEEHCENISSNSKDESSQLRHQTQQTIITTDEMQEVTAIPVVLTETNCLNHQQQTTFIVAPVSQILQTAHSLGENTTFSSYQLTTATADGYASQSNVETITVSAVSGTTSGNTYGFTAL